MRWFLPCLCLAFATSAVAAPWSRVSDDAAYTAIAAWLDADKSIDESWPALQAGFAPQGVFFGEQTTGRDDEGTLTAVAGWRSAAEMTRHKGLLSDVAMGVDSAECARSECTIGMSHAMAHLVIRASGGAPRIVGLFSVDAVLDAPGQAKIDATLAQWRRTIDQRYGAGKVDAKASAQAQAQVLNGAAIAMLKQKNFAGAIAALTRAVETDPAHHLARYNLACAQSLAGDFKASRATLAHFKAAKDCPACQVRLARARTDADFKAQRKDPAFDAIVAGATIPRMTPQAIAAAVNAVLSGQAATLGAAVDPLRRISLTIRQPGQKAKTTLIAGRDLAARLTALGRASPAKMRCAGECCTSAGALRSVCATADAAGWVSIDRIEVTRPR